jgi:2-keto-4-pentenoate hydratase
MGVVDVAVAELADELWRAERARTPIAPLTDAHPGLGIADGYAIQAHNVARRVAEGATVRGRKLGLTSRRTQQLLGVDEPTFGVLTDDMLVDDGAELSLAELVAPRVEAELAFVLATDLVGPGVTTEDALGAIGGVLPALEVVDSRIAEWRSRIADTVADNAGAAKVVLGRSTPVAGLDLRLLGVLLSRNGGPIDSGAGAAALGHPAAALAWLATTLAGFGEGLHAGDVVMAGALTRMVPVRPGDRFSAEFAHLGAVSVRFGAP